MLASWHSRGAQPPAAAAGGSLTLVGSRTFTHAGTGSTFAIPLTSLMGGIASAPRTGDLVVAFIGQAAQQNDDVTMPSGWSQLDRVQSVAVRSSDLYVIYKTMGATPDTGFDIVDGINSKHSIAVTIFVYEGASTAAPAFTTATGTATALCNPPAITPTVAGSIILSGGASGHFSVVQTFGSSAFDAFLTVGVEGGSNDTTIGVGRFAWTAGAFDPAVFTFSGSDSTQFCWAALSLILIPA